MITIPDTMLHSFAVAGEIAAPAAARRSTALSLLDHPITLADLKSSRGRFSRQAISDALTAAIEADLIVLHTNLPGGAYATIGRYVKSAADGLVSWALISWLPGDTQEEECATASDLADYCIGTFGKVAMVRALIAKGLVGDADYAELEAA